MLITNTSETNAYLDGTVGTQHDADSEAILDRLGVPDIVIQRILRHANVSASAT